MAKGFSIQHVATVPSGWHVRTVKAGAHRVRVAFPPGRRKKGSGIPVEVLHPRAENPLCYKNPAELLLMGANPTYPGKKATRERAARIRSARLGNPSPYDSLSVNEKLAFGRLGLGKRQLRTASAIAKARRKVAEVNRFRNAMPNPGAALPSLDAPEVARAQDLREAFTDSEVSGYAIGSEPHIPAGDYLLLGMFLAIAIKPTETGNVVNRQVMEIGFPNGRKITAMNGLGQMVQIDSSDVEVISAASGHPIYLTGDQSLEPPEVAIYTDSQADRCLLGEARSISYIEAKFHP